jgi:hypothetical protein
VIEARLDALPIPAGGPVAEDAPFPSHLRGRPVLDLSFRPGEPPPALAPLVTLHDAKEREVLLVGLDGDALVARRRLRAAGIGLENPAQRWEAVMPREDGNPVAGVVHRIELRFEGPVWRARFDGRWVGDRVWTPGRGWALFVPSEWIPPAALPGFDVAWIALLGWPAAYHAGRRIRSLAPLLVGVAALAAAPLFGAVDPARPAEWAGLLGAMGFGLWLRGPDSDRGDEV